MNSADFLNELIELAAKHGKSHYMLNRMAKSGSASLDNLSKLAEDMGYRIAIHFPDKDGWYSCGGKWKELVKMMVFHFWTAEDEEIIASGNLDQLEKIDRTSERRTRLLYQFGMDARCFTSWLQKGQVPKLESFLVLARAEGFQVKWSKIPTE
jgi:hypothetical protein